MSAPPNLLFVAWTERSGRADDIAAALDAESFTVFPSIFRERRWVAVRYAVSAVATLATLVRRRPSAVIVTNPPIVAALTVAGYCATFDIPFMLDSHPTAFGAKDHRVSQRLMFLHRWLVRRASATFVTTDQWSDVVESWGGRGLQVHEPPMLLGKSNAKTNTHQTVLFVGIFGGDEPVAEVVDAARLLPDVAIRITGDVRRRAPELGMNKPANVEYTGYLLGDDYSAALQQASIVLALTTEPTSVMRAAYEAVYARRPLIISDTPVLRDLFPTATFVANDAGSIAKGIQFALESQDDLALQTDQAYEWQLNRWHEQLDSIRKVLET